MQKRKSLLTFIFAHFLCFKAVGLEHYDLLIHGAGPGGLMSGIAALSAGARKVLVIEKRKRSAWAQRSRSIFLSDRTVETLLSHGVEVPATKIKSWHIVRNQKQRILPNEGHWKNEIFAQIFRIKYDSIVRIGDLEQSLLRRYLQMGGQVRFEAISEVLNTNGTLGVEARTQLESTVVSEVEAGLLVVAEGAKSSTREALGISMTSARVGSNPIYSAMDFTTSIQDTSEGGAFFFIDEQGHLEGYGCRANGYGSFGLIYPERYTIEAQKKKLDEMARQMGVHRADVMQTYRYVGELRIAETIQKGRVILIGDAARTTDPTSSSGLNTSIKDAVSVGRFFTEGSPPSLEPILLHLHSEISDHTRETFLHALYFQNLIEWANQSLRLLWGIAPVGRVAALEGSSRSWSVHDGFYKLGTFLPKGIQGRATTLFLRMAGAPRAGVQEASWSLTMRTHQPSEFACSSVLITDSKTK